MFRALTSPGWQKEWHVGVRASKSGKLVASICGVPSEIRVRGRKLRVIEINFLCIHKKLRSKRLAPVLIREITRRCYLRGIYQAIYTVGVVLPTPVTSCRYYHRALDWLKLYEVGFSHLPPGSTKARQITRNHLPNQTATPGLRPLEERDLDATYDLLERYLRRFDINPAFTKEEIDHWLLHRPERSPEQVVWSYVVEDPETHRITDFVSFYSLTSSVLGNQKHIEIRAAYLYYYATETAFAEKEKGLKERLQMLINDALIEAKKVHTVSFLRFVSDILMTDRRALMCLMPSRCRTTRSSWSSSSSGPVMASCTTIFSTTARRMWPEESMRGISRTKRRGAAWGWFCCRYYHIRC